MDQPIFKSFCGFSLASTCVIIGIIQSVIFAGIFFWQYALLVVDYMNADIPLRYYLESMTIIEMTNGATLICVIFSITMVVGVKKSQPGFILTWLVNQLVWIGSSLLTLLYFFVATYLRLPPSEVALELSVISVQVFCFLLVYSHFVRLRSGNFPEEPVYVD